MTKRLHNTASLLLIVFLFGGLATAQIAADAHDPFTNSNLELSTAASEALDRVGLPLPRRMITDAPLVKSQAAVPVLRGTRKSALERVEQLRPVVEPVLRQAGLPPDLAAVLLVESGGNPMALSRKGARGLWQLMPDTARRYGLVVSPTKDERLDAQKATWAASQYLRDLYAQFGDWRLALAAYNAGEGAVSRAVARIGSRDFSVLSLEHGIPEETRKYVPAVVADMQLMERADATSLVQPNTSQRTSLVYASIQLGSEQ